MVEWIKGHRRETEAINAVDMQDIRYNNIKDGLAKQAAKLAPQEIVSTSPASISIPGGEVPTPACKWILKLRRQHEVDGVHWVAWRSLKGIRHQLWAQWVWGPIAWIGCDYPGTMTKVTCPLCGLKHPGSVQTRLIQCPMWRDHFKREYCAAWGDWEPIAQRWCSQVSEEDLNHAARLRIPTLFANAVPLEQRHQRRRRAAEF